MDRNKDLEQVANQIWDSWYSRRGPCEDCPNYDHKGYFTPKNIDAGPESGNPSADIMIVGLEPSDEYNGVSRNEVSIDEIPEMWEKRNRNRDFTNLMENDNDQIRSWLFYQSDGKRRIDPVFEDKISGTIYYTNSKKCANTGEDDEIARGKCSHFLMNQIHAINPRVIVPFGEEALKSIQIDGIPSWNTYCDIALTTHGDQPPYIVPSYHWTRPRFNYNIENLGYNSSQEEEYWIDLAKEINSNL